jgi:hypothetical protein
MPITTLKHQRIRDSRPVLVIMAFALLANLLLIANPGFYNHDEW